MKVLDKGFVELVDCMGSDHRVCNAARVSNDLHGKLYSIDDDQKLIEFLMREQHTSPFEHVLFTFHIKMPIFIVRQHMRHRTASINEISGRYTEMKEEVFIPKDFHGSPKVRTQGRSDEVHQKSQKFGYKLIGLYDKIFSLYRDMVDAGVAKEEAREHLPLSLYTEFYWTINLHNLFHYLSLRYDPHSQKEIQDYAKAILDLITPVVPMCVEAWKNLKYKTITLTKEELDHLTFTKKIEDSRRFRILETKLKYFMERLEK